jgi:hypothetical protein
MEISVERKQNRMTASCGGEDAGTPYDCAVITPAEGTIQHGVYAMPPIQVPNVPLIL